MSDKQKRKPRLRLSLPTVYVALNDENRTPCEALTFQEMIDDAKQG